MSGGASKEIMEGPQGTLQPVIITMLFSISTAHQTTNERLLEVKKEKTQIIPSQIIYKCCVPKAESRLQFIEGKKIPLYFGRRDKVGEKQPVNFRFVKE